MSVARKLGEWSVALLLGAATLALTAAMGATGTTGPRPDVEFLRTWRAELHHPARLVVDGSGALYIADPGANTVVVRDVDGRFLERRFDLGRVVALGLDASGRILAGDETTGAVTAYDANWSGAYALGGGAGEFGNPTDIALDPASGRVYVSDGMDDEIRVYSPTGAFLFAFDGTDGMVDGLQFPTGLAIDGDVLFVVNQRSRQVCSFQLDGVWLSCFGQAGDRNGELFAPQGIAVDGDSRLYVTDLRLGRVLIFDDTGRWLDHIGEYGEAPGLFRQPADVAIDDNGRLFVANADNSRLEMYGLDAYADPERWAVGVVDVTPSVLTRGTQGVVRFEVEVPGYRLADLDLGSITVQGLVPDFVDVGRYDDDPQQELLIEIDRAALLAATPNDGVQDVAVQGDLRTLRFEALASIEVVPDAPDDSGIVDPGDTAGTPTGTATGTPTGAPGKGRGGASDGCGCGGSRVPSGAPLWVLALAIWFRRSRP